MKHVNGAGHAYSQCMDFSEIFLHVKTALEDTFQAVDLWFEQPEKVLSFQPAEGWSSAEVLEHIALTNHYLLMLIDKAAVKAKKNLQQLDLEDLLQAPKFDMEKLQDVGQHGAFVWIRPDHMIPSGTADLTEVRKTIRSQVDRCLQHLHDLSGGEGLLYTTTMTVNGLGRLNVYEYLYFVAMHARRHVTQMENNLCRQQA